MILVGIRGGGTGKPVSDAVNSYVNIPGSLIVHIKRQKQNLIFQDRRETAGSVSYTHLDVYKRQ